MPFYEGTYRSGDSEFPYSAWVAEPSERARVYLLHGMGSAPSEFSILGESLSAAGISVFAPALRGQGLDPDPRRRGTELKTEKILIDLENFLKVTPTSNPRFICGESMGALLSVQALIRPALASTFRGGILLCPVVELRKKTPTWMISTVHFLANIVPWASLHPGLFIHGKAQAPKLTEDVDYQNYLSHAPFRLPKVRLGFFSGISKLMMSSFGAGSKLTAPVMLFIAGKDPYISEDQSRRWFETIASSDKRLRLFSNSYHLLLHDTETAEVLAEFLSWLEARLAAESRLLR